MALRPACPPKTNIKLSGYEVKIETFEEMKKDEKVEESFHVRISYNSSESKTEFIDEFLISHQNRDFLLEVVCSIYACFSAEALQNGFIKYDANINAFEFGFESKTNILSVMRTCCLSKRKYTKQEAIKKIRDANSEILIRQNGGTGAVSVECINSHHIHDAQWLLEVTLNVSPGKYNFVVPDLLSKPTQIYVRDYIRIRDYYVDKLHLFYKKEKIFRLYLDHIESQSNKFIWTQMGFEAGPMSNLYHILSQIDDDDSIWSKLFDLCLIDVYETDSHQIITINSNDDNDSIADFITEQSVANFIASSIKFYCLQNRDKLFIQTDCHKYLLSIVLPYFSPVSQSDSNVSQSDVPLISGLFNRFVNFSADKDWKMKIDGAELKKSLLFHLSKAQIFVIKHTWNCRKLSVAEYDLIEADKEKKDGALICYDNSFESEWTMWTNKGLKRLYVSSKGYWKILNEFDQHPRVPINHLNAIRTFITKRNDVKPGTKVNLYADAQSDAFCAQYVISRYNPLKSTLSILIKKAFDALIDSKKKIKSRDSHFLYYKPYGIDWAWYNNDRAKYEEYNLGQNAIKQIEATYQGVQEYNFAMADYHRPGSEERLFIDAQLTELSSGMVHFLGLQYKPFVLRFTFNMQSSNVINMEQVAINANDGSQFPRNIRRLPTDSNAAAGTVATGTDHRLYALGTMNVTICQQQVRIKWLFNQSDTDNIGKMYQFEARIAMQNDYKYDCNDLVKSIKELWRSNNLFDQYQSSIIYNNEANNTPIRINKVKKGVLFEDIYKELVTAQEMKPKANYDVIIGRLSNVVTDNMWNALDAMDGNMREHEEKELVSVFNEYHQKAGFCAQIFTLIALDRVQSIISVLKQEISDGKKVKTEDLLIIALSNQQLLFESVQTTTTQTTTFTQSLSHIFDKFDNWTGFIKRIDSKNTIYDLEIADFHQTITNAHYLHDFMAISSAAYTETLFIFKRPECKNIYISYNGFVRKLSLEIYNEDLYYFLPSFITLKIGNFIDVESFCYRDCGTILQRFECIQTESDDMIYYKIRSSQNIFYILNYYQITNRAQPKLYYTQCRQSLIDKKLQTMKTFAADPNELNDPSDPSHPMHTFSLSLFESSKQTISSINNGNVHRLETIENKLKQCGNIYLLHRTVENGENSDEIRQLLQEKPDEMKEILSQFDSSNGGASNMGDLDGMIRDLESRKLISCKQVMDEDLTYNTLMNMNADIFASNTNNKIYIIDIVEVRQLILKQEELKKEEDEEEEEEHEDADYDSDSDNWVTYEEDVEEDDAGTGLKKTRKSAQKIEISIASTFKCKILCSYEMSLVYPGTNTVEDLIVWSSSSNNNNGRHKWSVDENRLLTYFYNNGVYNEYDLNDKNIMNRVRRKLYAKCNDSTNEPHFIKLYKKFDEFIKRVAGDLPAMSNNNNNLINGVEVTRNAVLLQQHYIDAKWADNGMVITYNPLQSCVITGQTAKDITHPIHIYRSAYSFDLSSFLNNFQLDALYNGWMRPPQFPQTVNLLYKKKQTTQPKANIIDTLSLLIRYNKKYEIVLVPSSIALDAGFLDTKCAPIAPDIDAIAMHRVTFIYKGILYNYFKKQPNLKQDEKADGNDDDDRFFLDEIKFLVRKIKENIIEDCIDWMDVQSDSDSVKRRRFRLRSTIKRNNRDIMLRWLKIGCGSCFLHEASGRQTEIGPPPSMDYDNDFPDLLRKAMFIYYIDCKIPFSLNPYQSANKICHLCGNYIIDGYAPCEKHRFCYKCILQWKEMINNPDWGTLKEYYQENKIDLQRLIASDEVNVLRDIILPQYCPLYIECHKELDDIPGPANITKEKEKEKENKLLPIPMTVYQQVLNENNVRYQRLDLLNRYQQKREMQLIRDQTKLSLQELRQKYPHMDQILAGY